jgi:hypothetical protein
VRVESGEISLSPSRSLAVFVWSVGCDVKDDNVGGSWEYLSENLQMGFCVVATAEAGNDSLLHVGLGANDAPRK